MRLPKIFRLVLALIALTLAILPAGESSAQGALVLDGVIIDRSNLYDAYPVHLLVNGVHHLWFCGQSPVTQHDAIFHSTNPGPLSNTGGWSTPVELLNIHDVPWAFQGGGIHVCDPTVLRGNFLYQGLPYSYAMYFTADTTSAQTGDGATGVAFSNNGTQWVVHPQPVITPDGGFDGTYGAGAGGVAWGPEAGKIHHVYRDSTTSFGVWRIRYKASTDAITFVPTPSLDTQMSQAAASNFGSAPEIAYFPYDSQWYGAIQSIAGGDAFTVRVIRTLAPHDLFSSWQTITGFSGSFAGEELALLPSTAKIDNSTLYVDPEGWIYLFFTAGNLPGNRPGVKSWKIVQARYRLQSPLEWRLADRFSNVGQTREVGDSLNATRTEVGAAGWTAASPLVVSQNAVTTNSSAGGSLVTLVPRVAASQNDLQVEARLDISGSEWVAVGLSTSATDTGGLFTGEVWLLLHNLLQEVFVYADGLTYELARTGAIPLSTGWNDCRLVYSPAANTVQAFVNGAAVFPSPFSLSTVGFTPNVGAGGFHMLNASPGATRVDDFELMVAP